MTLYYRFNGIHARHAFHVCITCCASPAGRADAALAGDQVKISSQPGRSIRPTDRLLARGVTDRIRQVHALVIRPLQWGSLG